MIVKVTQEHIDKAIEILTQQTEDENGPKTAYYCPVALALKDQFKVDYVSAGYWDLRVGQFPENLVFCKETPEEVFKWMTKFDNRNNSENIPQPFEFELSLEGVKL